MAEGLDFLIPSLLFMKGALIDNQRSSNKFAASGNRSALRLPGSFRRRGFHRPIGKYGRMHREYLREVHPARLNTLILTGELWTYLADLNEQAQERIDTIIE